MSHKSYPLHGDLLHYIYYLFIILTVVAHRLGRTCIHKVGQYYVKPGQIQAVGTVEEKKEPLKEVEGGKRSENDEEGLEEEPTKTAAKEG